MPHQPVRLPLLDDDTESGVQSSVSAIAAKASWAETWPKCK